jgi:hypothetical protein
MVNEGLNGSAAWQRLAALPLHFSTARDDPAAPATIWPQDGLNVAANLRCEGLKPNG